MRPLSCHKIIWVTNPDFSHFIFCFLHTNYISSHQLEIFLGIFYMFHNHASGYIVTQVPGFARARIAFGRRLASEDILRASLVFTGTRVERNIDIFIPKLLRYYYNTDVNKSKLQNITVTLLPSMLKFASNMNPKIRKRIWT